MIHPRLKSPQSPYKQKLKEIAGIAKYIPLASIMKQSRDFNYTILQSNHLKRKQIPKKELQQFNDLFDNSKSKKKRKNIPVLLPRLPTKINQNILKQDTQDGKKFLTVDTRIDTDDVPTMEKNKKNKYKIDYQAKFRYMVQENPLDHQSNSNKDSQDQYTVDATPGPGYYSINSSFSTNKESKINKFGGNAPRFRYQPKQQLRINPNPQQKEIINIKKVKKVPFNSKSPRQIKHNHQGPGPQEYSPRFGIQEDLIRKIQRNFKGSFGTCQKRFQKLQQNDILGPGRYYIKQNKDNQLVQSYFFLSKNPRFSQSYKI